MVLRCGEILRNDCPVVFDGENGFVASQMSAHIWGSHGIRYAESQFLSTTPVEERPEEKSVVETNEAYSQKVEEKIPEPDENKAVANKDPWMEKRTTVSKIQFKRK